MAHLVQEFQAYCFVSIDFGICCSFQVTLVKMTNIIFPTFLAIFCIFRKMTFGKIQFFFYFDHSDACLILCDQKLVRECVS